MCAALMDVKAATTDELRAAVQRKFDKFGTVDAMPAATRELVEQGVVELQARDKRRSA